MEVVETLPLPELADVVEDFVNVDLAPNDAGFTTILDLRMPPPLNSAFKTRVGDALDENLGNERGKCKQPQAFQLLAPYHTVVLSVGALPPSLAGTAGFDSNLIDRNTRGRKISHSNFTTSAIVVGTTACLHTDRCVSSRGCTDIYGKGKWRFYPKERGRE